LYNGRCRNLLARENFKTVYKSKQKKNVAASARTA
jgi:hypothetical protein